MCPRLIELSGDMCMYICTEAPSHNLMCLPNITTLIKSFDLSCMWEHIQSETHMLLVAAAEGYEHEVLPTWKTGSVLPDELSIEFHVAAGELFSGWPGTTAELGLTFLLLANLGYAAYSQEVNAGAPHCCSEFTFLRLAGTT